MANIDVEQEKSRAEIADYFHKFADELDPQRGGETGITDASPSTGTPDTRDKATGRTDESRATGDAPDGRKVTVIVGNESATINPPETLLFDIAVNTDSSMLAAGEERSATFSLRWSEENVETDDELRVE